jgi:hypothetical protein
MQSEYVTVRVSLVRMLIRQIPSTRRKTVLSSWLSDIAKSNPEVDINKLKEYILN